MSIYTYKLITNYKTCIDCDLGLGEFYLDGKPVDFFEPGGGRGPQHTYRCTRCERKYVDGFIAKHQKTKTRYKHTPLTKYERGIVLQQQSLIKGDRL